MDEILMTKEEVLRRNKRAVLLIVLFLSTLLILVVGTYAWFVGFSKAEVNNFTVNITTKDSLQISLDGYTWSEELNITENSIKSHTDGGEAYADNYNFWVGEEGLVPVSSSGDNYEGLLEFYSKNSLTGTAGGYRVVSDYLDNTGEEFNYYVSFDIFVKNTSGDIYTKAYDIFNDENIFLTPDSSITGTASGETAYGIQNSARVAFVQLGRINMDDLETDTTPNIKCVEPGDDDIFTPLCHAYGNVYNTVIWEPNDTSHDTKLITYYNTLCKSRTTNLVYGTDNCTDLSTGYVPTYTIKKQITTSDKVDIYDGLNGYPNNIQSDSDEYTHFLQNTKTYTDTMKDTEGEYTLFKLAPHSVTKIRVYVYLEGQDVDNYDLAMTDTQISVNFGFTKERNTANPINDSEPQKVSFSIGTENYSMLLNPNEASSYTFKDLLEDHGEEIESNLVCYKEICACTIGDNIIIRPIGSGLGTNGAYDSDSELITIYTHITNGAVFTRTLDPDFGGDEIDFTGLCREGSQPIKWSIDGTAISFNNVRFETVTWELWINKDVQVDNDDVKCNNYACIVKDSGKVVAKASYTNNTYTTDKLMDESNYFSEKHHLIQDNVAYTTQS